MIGTGWGAKSQTDWRGLDIAAPRVSLD